MPELTHDQFLRLMAQQQGLPPATFGVSANGGVPTTTSLLQPSAPAFPTGIVPRTPTFGPPLKGMSLAQGVMPRGEMGYHSPGVNDYFPGGTAGTTSGLNFRDQGSGAERKNARLWTTTMTRSWVCNRLPRSWYQSLQPEMRSDSLVQPSARAPYSEQPLFFPMFDWDFDGMNEAIGKILWDPNPNSTRPRTVAGPEVTFKLGPKHKPSPFCSYALFDTVWTELVWCELVDGAPISEPPKFRLVPETKVPGDARRQGPYRIDNTDDALARKDPVYKGQKWVGEMLQKVDYPGRNDGWWKNAARDVLRENENVNAIRLQQNWILECWLVETCDGKSRFVNFIEFEFTMEAEFSRGPDDVLNVDVPPHVVKAFGGASGTPDEDELRIVKNALDDLMRD